MRAKSVSTVILAGILNVVAACGGGASTAASDAGVDAAGDTRETGEADAATARWQLRPGTGIEEPRLVTVAGEPWVLYNQRQTTQTTTLGGKLEVRLVRWADGAQDRTLIAGVSDRFTWRPAIDSAQAWLYMTDERLVAGNLPVGTLNRVSLTAGTIESLPDVINYGQNSTRQLFYYRKFVGTGDPDLHLRDLSGHDRNLGRLTGRVAWAGESPLFFIGENGALTRVASMDAPAEVLHTGVSRFLPAKSHVIVTVEQEGKPRDLILDLLQPTQPPRPLPVVSSCCWITASGTRFVFGEAATASTPATLHQMDLVTGADQMVVLPRALVDVTGALTRPTGDELVVNDSQYHVALVRGGEAVALPGLTAQPRFSPDGQHFLCASADAPPAPNLSFGGTLYQRSASDWNQPPQRVSPEGTQVYGSGFFFATMMMAPYRYIYWADRPAARADLHAVDLATGQDQLLAGSIFFTSIASNHLLVIANAEARATGKPQTGDLIYRNLTSDRTLTIERTGVTTMTSINQRVVFVINDPTPNAPRTGMWATTLPALD